MNRFKFLSASASIAAAWALPGSLRSLHNRQLPVKAILFDAFPVFDPGNVFSSAIRMFPEKGPELVREWRARQFEYTWLRTISGNYVDFLTVTSDALRYACQLLKVEISEPQQQQLMDEYYRLRTWPEVAATLARLRAAGYRLGMLSNFTPEMMRINMNNCKISTHFEHLLSVDPIKRYKPDPLTYQMGMDVFGLAKEEILFVPFAGWDAAGSKNFGYRTFWVNRLQTPPERLGPLPDGEGKDLNDLVRYL